MVLILPLGLLAHTQGGKISKRKVASVFSSFKNSKGVESLSLGRLGTSLLKGAAKLADDGDGDTRQALTAMKGLTGISILSYEEAEKPLQQKISSRLQSILADAELLMEAKDEGETVKIYGSVNEKTGKLSDVAFFAPSDCAFIFLSGSFDIEDLTKVLDKQ